MDIHAPLVPAQKRWAHQGVPALRQPSQGLRGMSIRNLIWLRFGISNRLKKNSNSSRLYSLCCDFQNWVQVWAPACNLAISPKAVPEGNWKFRGQEQWPSWWGSSAALLVWVRCSSTLANTWCFLVCCSRCKQLQACLRKTCYHSCDTHSVCKSKRF